MSPILTLQGFGVSFMGRTVLRSLDLQVQAKGCTVLLGPSGTGKSTLLRSLAGLNPPSASTRIWGQVLYDTARVNPDFRPALVQQKAQLLMSSVSDNLVSGLPQRSRLSRTAQLELVEAALHQFGQAALASKLAEQVIDLPVHEQRIVAIARQGLARPALLLVDEPTANLAPDAAAQVLQVLRMLAQDCAVLQVSHHLQQTRDWSDQVILIADGVVQEAAPTEQFFGAPRSAAAQCFVRTGSCPEGLDPPLAPAFAPDVEPQGASNEPISAYCGPRGFVWLLAGQVAGTPWPGVMQDVDFDLQALRAVGIQRLISLTETPFDPGLAKAYGIQCSSSPIADMQAPSLTQAWALCTQIDGLLKAGEVVAVHCKAGLGRTGVVLAAYWLWHGRGSGTAEEAIRFVRRLESGMIQSNAQEQFLERFAQLVAQWSSTHATHGEASPLIHAASN